MIVPRHSHLVARATTSQDELPTAAENGGGEAPPAEAYFPRATLSLNARCTAAIRITGGRS